MDCREFPMTRIENMEPKLYKAAMDGDIDLQTSMGIIGCRPDLRLCLTPQKNTALHIAVKFNQQKIVKRMIEMCPSLISQCNSKDDTPLHMAARFGCPNLLELLTPALNLNLTEGNPNLDRAKRVRQAGRMALRMRNLEGSNPIHEALKKSHGEVALHLLAFEEGHHELAREVNNAGESILYLAAEAGLVKVVEKIIDTGDYSISGPDGLNPLLIAVIKGQLGVVEILLEKAPDLITQVDFFGNTALHYASAGGFRWVLADERWCKNKLWERFYTERRNRIQILELLLKAGQSLAYVPNKNGDYPLFIAVRSNFDLAIGTILDHCPDSFELVNQNGQNVFHLAVIEKDLEVLWNLPTRRFEFMHPINEPDNDGNTPMHLATLTNQEKVVELLINRWAPDLTMSNKEGLTAMDICGYTETEHPIRNKLRDYGAVLGRHQWQERFPMRSLFRIKEVKISPEFKKLGLQTLPIVTSLVATVTFAAAFTVPGGYKNDGPREGLPVFMRNAALQVFVLSDIVAFCCSMAATILVVYANAHAEDAFKIYCAIHTCYYISGVAIVATVTAFVTAVYVLTSKESLWLAVTSLVLGFVVLLFLAFYRWGLKKLRRYLFRKDHECYSFE